MGFILALGAGFALFLYYLSHVPATTLPLEEKATKASPSRPAKPTSKPTNPADAPRFEFYQILPEAKVTAPRVETYTPKETKDPSIFILQTGSFRALADAERQRATLGFQGMQSQISKISGENGGDWYRVEVGPFTSRTKMNAALDKLVAININPLIRQSKPEKSP